MRVSSVSLNYSVNPKIKCQPKPVLNVNFRGKHDCAKLLGGAFAGLGTLGALGGIAIMTGGVSLIPTLIYGSCCGGAGAILGNMIDKGHKDGESDKKD